MSEIPVRLAQGEHRYLQLVIEIPIIYVNILGKIHVLNSNHQHGEKDMWLPSAAYIFLQYYHAALGTHLLIEFM